MARRKAKAKSVDALTHSEDSRKNLPSAEHQPLMREDEQSPYPVRYARRNRDLDPQLVWRGKDEQDLSDLVVNVPPLYIQERVHPKSLIDDLRRYSDERQAASGEQETEQAAQSSFADFFADFNGLPSPAAATEFYEHDANWSNRMILGDSLQVMASLAEREGLRGQVQCIYLDPPYGIKFNSNFQWSTRSRDVRDGNKAHVTREPEQVKAFRDTWRDGIHSYLTYLRDRLTVARDLLTESGSIFVQIGDENVHLVRSLMGEVFGEENFVSEISFAKTTGFSGSTLSNVSDYILWYARDLSRIKYRPLWKTKVAGEVGAGSYREVGSIKALELYGFSPTRLAALADLTSQGESKDDRAIEVQGKRFGPRRGMHWKTTTEGLERLIYASRVVALQNTPAYVRFMDDFPVFPLTNYWTDTVGQNQFGGSKTYVVQTALPVIERCLLMVSDPSDLVLDPTCGSGTTAYVAEQWGRRWITIDTSRVALALARARIMGARYPYYLLADSPAGQAKEEEITGRAASEAATYGRLRQGFVYERVPHISLGAIAKNTEIDVIYKEYQEKLEPLREDINQALNTSWDEWEIPREVEDSWPQHARNLHARWWELRLARQEEIDASIARNGESEPEYLYDRPCDDPNTVRVAGPFTVESISPHRVLAVDENDEFLEGVAEPKGEYGETVDFPSVILDNLRTSGVQQAHREDRIAFTSVTPWPGAMVCAEGLYTDGNGKDSAEVAAADGKVGAQRRAAIFIGPEFGTVSRADLVDAAIEAADARFDVLISCAFNYEAHTTEFESLGRVPVLKARMNPDLHMADELKNTGNGNLFVIFGEPDVIVASEEWLVDSDGRPIAPYEVFKLVSGLGSLAEVNGLDCEDICAYAALSCRREVWDYLTNAAGGELDTGKHSGRAGAANNWGVSTVAWHCAGIAGGTGDLPRLMREAGTDRERGLRELVERLRRDKQDAERFDAFALHSPLTTHHWSQVKINGVDVFNPSSGDVSSDDSDTIPCWFIDTDYNGESFFVRQAYFPGTTNDPYKSLKTTLRAEINREAWETLRSDTSRPFDRPESGRIAVKVINHLGDEVMKVFRV